MIFRRRRRHGDLDHALMMWAPRDPWTVRHACQNTLVVGKTGSGKSSGAGDHLLRAIVGYPNTGGAIFASKPEDKAYVTRLFREERTLDDLYILEPGGRCRFNVLDFERRKGADTRDLSQACMTFAETLASAEGGGGRAGGGEDGAYWAGQQRMMLHNAIEILLRATGQVDPWSMQLFIQGAALSLEETGDPRWKESYHCTLLQEARKAPARPSSSTTWHWPSNTGHRTCPGSTSGPEPASRPG